jgi:hypothetical protein
MSVDFLGRYLLEQAVISREALLDTLEYQRSKNRTVADLALERGYVDQARRDALTAQIRRTGRRFEDCALESGALTRAQLGELMLHQMERWVFFPEALVVRKHISRRALEPWLLRYRTAQAGYEGEEPALPDLPHADLIASFIPLTAVFLEQVTGVACAVTETAATPPPADWDVLLMQRLHGDRNLLFALALPAAVANLLGAGGDGAPATGAMTGDLEAVAEFVNITAGNACARLSTQGIQLSMDPVRTYRRGEPVPWRAVCVNGTLRAGDHTFTATLSFD